MCGKATDWVWNLDLPQTTKMVLLALARHIKSAKADRWTCDHGQAELAERIGLSERHIRRHIADLQARGLLEVIMRPGEGQGKKTNIYKLLKESLATQLETEKEPQSNEATGHGRPLAQGGATGHGRPLAPEATGHLGQARGHVEQARGHGRPLAPSNERARGRNERARGREYKTLLEEKTEGRPRLYQEKIGGQRESSTQLPARACETAKTLSCPLSDIARNTITELRPDLDPETTWGVFAAYYDGQQHADGEWQRLWKLWILREWKNNKKRSMIAKSDRPLGDFLGAAAETDLNAEYEVIHES